MPSIPRPTAVESEGDHVRVRYRDPAAFETIGTPDWAEQAAESVVEGSRVRLGKRPGDDWTPQSVLIPAPADADEARRQADEILQRIEF